MAQFVCKTLKEWGVDSFCVRDYVDYITNARENESDIPPVRDDEYFMGMVLFDVDTVETIRSLIGLCHLANPSIIRIDVSNITTDEGARRIAQILDEEDYKLDTQYHDLQSYEYSYAFGLRGPMREKFITDGSLISKGEVITGWF